MNEFETNIWKNLDSWFLDSIQFEIYNQYLKKGFINIVDHNANIVVQELGKLGEEILNNLSNLIKNKLFQITNTKYSLLFISKKEFDKKQKIQKSLDDKNSWKLSIDNFVVGESNKKAYNVAKLIIDNPNEIKFNPILLYGDSGLGKTHLLNAIHFELEKKGFSTYFSSSTKFRKEYVNIASKKEFDKLDEFYNYDFLLIDDINLIISGESTETLKFLLQLLNDFIDAKKGVIFVSDVYPNNIPRLNERIKSRLISGLTVEIKNLDKETAKKILLFKLKSQGLKVSDEVVDYIVDNYRNSVRELEGLINKILLIDIQNDGNLSLLNIDNVEDLLDSPITIKHEGDGLKSLLHGICLCMNLSMKDVQGKLRTKEIAQSRHRIAWLLKEMSPSSSLKDIGNILGGRDHSTINNSITLISNNIAVDKQLKDVMNKLKKKVNSQIFK